ncbi:type III secretion system inner rod subunit SctI [Prosthecomicrobium sp. N25]|uniref:type III secretion system inner rod subunit SctI n=1 Tax=Prosthecomicrobium sp. N25 TaxID=3129254 RepID=UPI00307875BD
MATITTVPGAPRTESLRGVGLDRPTGPGGDGFDAAMRKALGAAQPTHVAQAAPPVVTDAQPVADPGAAERARRGLGLEGPSPVAPEPNTGDAIIEGLQKLRGVFDDQNARLNAVANAANTDFSSLMAMQMEMVRFSLLVEVTSKLTGKSTQAFDTLMKGQ